MIIREMRLKDINACAVITNANWGKRIAVNTRVELQYLLKNKLARYYLALQDDGRAAGFAGIMPSWIMRDVWDLIWINVHPDFHGQGVGRELTEYIINQVISRNGAAIHLMTQKPDYFKKFDFHSVHSYNGDWTLMVNQLRELKL